MAIPPLAEGEPNGLSYIEAHRSIEPRCSHGERPGEGREHDLDKVTAPEGASQGALTASPGGQDAEGNRDEGWEGRQERHQGRNQPHHQDHLEEGSDPQGPLITSRAGESEVTAQYGMFIWHPGVFRDFLGRDLTPAEMTEWNRQAMQTAWLNGEWIIEPTRDEAAPAP